MLRKLANIATALTLMLSASAATPALAGGSHDDRKCTAKHAHAKRTATPPARKPSPERGVMIVEKRKMDVQILSFGP